MGQPPLTEKTSEKAVEPQKRALPFFPASIAGEAGEEAFVVVVRTPLEFCWWLRNATPAVQWIQVEGLLDESEVWATAARKEAEVALDVIVSDPASEYSSLYRLVDVRNVRDVRVTIPVVPGLMKALRLAASLQLPVRLLPGRIDAEGIAELKEAVRFYLHDPMVEAPVDFFHSCLISMREEASLDLWMILEQDPNAFPRYNEQREIFWPGGGPTTISDDFLGDHLANLSAARAECISCRWRDLCGGYFKLPDPDFSCTGIIGVFDQLKAASDEMDADLAGIESPIGADGEIGENS